MSDLFPLPPQTSTDSFRQIYTREKMRLWNTAIRLCGNREDAEDCLQETFIRAFRHMDSFRADSSIGTWLYRILANVCANHRRSRPETLEWIDEWYGFQDPDWSLKRQLETAIQQLEPGNRTVFILYEIEGFSHQEIGDILQISEGTSKSRLSRSKSILKEKLAGAR